jgi:6-pyruvoyltetrahydropterin/6-carboxytetrahydropterin synthase
MLTKVSKEFKWEMSHRLPFHKGPCKNIHGHTYKLRIDLDGYPDENGMLVDFYDMELIMRPIIDSFDHCFLCDKDDTLMLDFLTANCFKTLVLPYTSTSENIAKYIAEKAMPEFKKIKSLTKIYIRLFETEDVFAEINEEINR